jgi:hypothetical protein
MDKVISFPIFKRICEDKYFEDRGNCFYFIKCKRGIPFCNERVCPEWNKLKDAPAPLLSLREINNTLKNGNE